MHILKSFIFPIFSPQFYKEAYAQGIKKAILVYTLFSLLMTILFTLGFFLNTLLNWGEVNKALDEFPTINYSNGILSINSKEPIEYSNEGKYFYIDTNKIEAEIPVGYSEAIILLKDKLIVRSSDAYGDQTISYEELARELNIQNFEFGKDEIAQFINIFKIVGVFLVPFFYLLWIYSSRIWTILIIAIIGTIILSLMKHSLAFRKSLIITIYASIPVFYINFILSTSGKIIDKITGINLSLGIICCLFPVIFSLVKWFIFWGIGISGIKKIS